jgi:hypothetical protein
MPTDETWDVNKIGRKDVLLITAKVGTILVRIGLVIGMIGIGVAGAVTVISPDALSSHLQVKVSAGGLQEVTGGIVLVLATTLVSFALMYDFVTRLAQIIDTVGEGDPFTAANAARLTRMGWLAVIVQLLGLPVMLLSTWLGSYLDHDTFELKSEFTLTGFGLAIVLFVLARVFRKGTEMREELEGTV